MNSNWRKPENKAGDCILDIMLKTNDLNYGVPCEICPHWLWRPCLFCNGNGYITRVDKTCGVKQLDECGWCNGTGHDGSGLGRCGLIRG